MDDLSNKKERKFNIDSIDFETLFKKKQEEHEKEREAYYKEKAEKEGSSLESVREKRKRHSDEVTVYKAKTAALAFKEKAAVKESFIHRTIRLVKGLSATRKKIKNGGVKLTEEMKTKLYKDLFEDAWEPVTTFFKNMVDDSWEFICTFWDDFVEIIIFIVNLIITASYYVGSILIYIWDIIWDIRLWFDARKNKIFQYFALSIGILAVALISISSISAYEYSYYGRVLGITRTKQEVYQTIDALGEKLSEASGANVNLDVERDIKFKRVVGLNLDVDNSEDILNTLTYMRDIQVRAYAINIDGKQAVVLENEETANTVLQAVKDYFVPEVQNVEYTSVAYDQTVTVDEVGVLLGDIWNPADAAMYIERGTTKISDEIKVSPLVTVRTTEIEKIEKNVAFGTKYIESSELYVGEHDLITAGIYGINEVVSEISRVNGEEIQRRVVSTTRTKNPVDAVYYTGTKPVPEKKGTGTFIWPVKNMKSSMLTSKFGSRNTGIIGASRNHEGIDIGVPYGTKIYACDGGVVKFAGWRAGYGNLVIIDHGGLFETRYAHNSKLLVSTGEEVYQGQAIAQAGNSGTSSGPHCHLEIRFNGTAKNPLDYLPDY